MPNSNLFLKYKNDETVMYFDNHEPYTFKEAIANLCGASGEENTFNGLLTSAKNYVAGFETEKDVKQLASFHNWVLSIHNSHLIPPQGSPWPNNIFYKMLQDLRNLNSQDQLTSEEVFLLFMMEGLNGRKIKGGETPGTEFISTALANQVIKNIELLNIKDEKTEQYKKKYSLIEDLAAQYKSFMDGFEKFKQDKESLISILSSKGALDLVHNKNETTGANSYSAKEGVLADKSLLKGLTVEEINKIANATIEFLSDQADQFMKLIPNLETAKINLQDQLLLWDLSEYVQKAYLALVISLNGSPEVNLREVMNKPFINDILMRNTVGDYPVAKNREKDLIGLDQITKIFQQQEIHDYQPICEDYGTITLTIFGDLEGVEYYG